MKKFEEDDVMHVNPGMSLVAYKNDGTPLFALEQGVAWEDMTSEQREFAYNTARSMMEHPELEFWLGKMEPIEDLDDLDLPVIVWVSVRNRRSYYDPIDVADARGWSSHLDFYKLV